MIKIILYVLGILLAFNGAYQLIKYLIVISEIKKKFFIGKIKDNSEDLHKILVFVPVLHEEKIIEKFLTNFS